MKNIKISHIWIIHTRVLFYPPLFTFLSLSFRCSLLAQKRNTAHLLYTFSFLNKKENGLLSPRIPPLGNSLTLNRSLLSLPTREPSHPRLPFFSFLLFFRSPHPTLPLLCEQKKTKENQTQGFPSFFFMN